MLFVIFTKFMKRIVICNRTFILNFHNMYLLSF